MENLEKSWKKLKSKVMEMCYNHMFIDAEFEITHMFFFKKDAQNISWLMLSKRNIF